MICVGILAALLVNVALPAAAWRSMFALAAVPAALLGLGGFGAGGCRPGGCFRAVDLGLGAPRVLSTAQASVVLWCVACMPAGKRCHPCSIPALVSSQARNFAVAFLPCAGMLVCPESPAWLVLKGHRREAGAVVEKLWGPDGTSQLGAGAANGKTAT